MKKKNLHIIIVGAGASGLVAAIRAARLGAQVTLLEQKEKVGKKILATGNGHCNFTNEYMHPSYYHGNTFAIDVIRRFNVQDTLNFFQELGIFPHEREGYYYPVSEQASAVAGLLEQEARRLGVLIMTDTCVRQIIPLKTNQADRTEFEVRLKIAIKSAVKETVKKNGKKKITVGEIRYQEKSLYADKVILACGGKAYPALGSDGSGYELAEKLGHTIITPLPALTGIRCEDAWFDQLAGVRVSAKVTVWVNGREVASDTGELQLTDYGISGIPAFQVSRYVARALEEGKKPIVSICFYPELTEEKLLEYLKTHTLDQYCGLYPEKLLSVLVQILKQRMHPKKDDFEKGLAHLTRESRWYCEAVNGFDRAQVTCGGVDLKQVNPETLESMCCPGIYFAGELLDVDGVCGGYNLQWAWSSGWIAASAAAESGQEK